MPKYVAKRIRLRNGERHSVLQVPNGLPVHEVTLYLDKYRRKGRAANTIHFVCTSLALLYGELDRAKVNLLDRLSEGAFLTMPELSRLASAVQYRIEDLEEAKGYAEKSNVIHTGFTYSRFTFAEYPQIANAFSLKKEALRGTWKSERGEPRDERVRAALNQVDRYKAKIQRLEQENQLLLEQFVTWAHNAERKGVTVMMLNAPLPKPHRDRSKEVK